MNKRIELFISFFKIGAFTFGGGYAMLPIMEQEIVEKKKWITEEDVIDIVAISESTPGVLAVNFATYIGYKVGGFFGSLLATLGVVLPSFFIILLISLFLNAFKSNELIQNFLLGIKSGVVVLLLNAVLKLSKTCRKEAFGIVVMLVSFLIAILLDLPVIIMLTFGGLSGIIFGLITKGGKK